MYKRKYGILPAICLTLMMSSATVTLAADTQQAVEVKGYIGPRSAAPSNGTGSAETSNRTKAPNSAAQPSGSKSHQRTVRLKQCFLFLRLFRFQTMRQLFPKQGIENPSCYICCLLWPEAGGLQSACSD